MGRQISRQQLSVLGHEVKRGNVPRLDTLSRKLKDRLL